jgi:hypothetical protein
MNVYYDKDADLSIIKGKKVAILGYGSRCVLVQPQHRKLKPLVCHANPLKKPSHRRMS